MFTEIFKQAWTALGRNPVRSFLTMSGISWGIVAVTLLLSYGSGFRSNRDRKSTRLNSSHGSISYAVFCLKKKKISEWKRLGCVSVERTCISLADSVT